MPHRSSLVALPLMIAMLFAGCHSKGNAIPVGTFVNSSDSTQVLELKVDPSQTPNMFLRIGMLVGANKVFGKTVGVYTLKTNHGASAGTFVSVIPLRGAGGASVTLDPRDGKRWSLETESDGSLRDSLGNVWRLRTP